MRYSASEKLEIIELVSRWPASRAKGRFLPCACRPARIKVLLETAASLGADRDAPLWS